MFTFAKFFVLKTYGEWFIESDILLLEKLPLVDSKITYIPRWEHLTLSSSEPIYIGSGKNNFFDKVYEDFSKCESSKQMFDVLDRSGYPDSEIDGLENMYNVRRLNILYEHFDKISGAKIENGYIILWNNPFKVMLFAEYFDRPEMLTFYCSTMMDANPSIGHRFNTVGGLALYYKFIRQHIKNVLHEDPDQYMWASDHIKEQATLPEYNTFGGFDDDLSKIEEILKNKDIQITTK